MGRVYRPWLRRHAPDRCKDRAFKCPRKKACEPRGKSGTRYHPSSSRALDYVTEDGDRRGEIIGPIKADAQEALGEREGRARRVRKRIDTPDAFTIPTISCLTANGRSDRVSTTEARSGRFPARNS